MNTPTPRTDAAHKRHMKLCDWAVMNAGGHSDSGLEKLSQIVESFVAPLESELAEAKAQLDIKTLVLEESDEIESELKAANADLRAQLAAASDGWRMSGGELIKLMVERDSLCAELVLVRANWDLTVKDANELRARLTAAEQQLSEVCEVLECSTAHDEWSPSHRAADLVKQLATAERDRDTFQLELTGAKSDLAEAERRLTAAEQELARWKQTAVDADDAREKAEQESKYRSEEYIRILGRMRELEQQLEHTGKEWQCMKRTVETLCSRYPDAQKIVSLEQQLARLKNLMRRALPTIESRITDFADEFKAACQ